MAYCKLHIFDTCESTHSYKLHKNNIRAIVSLGKSLLRQRRRIFFVRVRPALLSLSLPLSFLALATEGSHTVFDVFRKLVLQVFAPSHARAAPQNARCAPYTSSRARVPAALSPGNLFRGNARCFEGPALRAIFSARRTRREEYQYVVRVRDALRNSAKFR